MANELLENLDRLHTTELGVIRIKKNLYHINAGRSATSIVATDSVFLFKGQSETWLSFSL